MTNYCSICGIDLGPQNPRQLCGKTYCIHENDNTDEDPDYIPESDDDESDESFVYGSGSDNEDPDYIPESDDDESDEDFVYGSGSDNEDPDYIPESDDEESDKQRDIVIGKRKKTNVHYFHNETQHFPCNFGGIGGSNNKFTVGRKIDMGRNI